MKESYKDIGTWNRNIEGHEELDNGPSLRMEGCDTCLNECKYTGPVQIMIDFGLSICNVSLHIRHRVSSNDLSSDALLNWLALELNDHMTLCDLQKIEIKVSQKIESHSFKSHITFWLYCIVFCNWNFNMENFETSGTAWTKIMIHIHVL